ncbi:MAG: c-type cytochrome [Acidobacteriota bacterium]|jgi:cbb3-type cytochrome oxidase cytochrome c subunit
MAKRKGVYARDIDKLNMIFAVVAIGCLLSVVWMVWDDYAREWKGYQRQFQVIDQEVTAQQLQDTEAGLNQQRLSELQQQRAAAEETLAGQQEQISALEDQLADVQTDLELATQEFRFARSVFDSRRWSYEEAARHGEAESERAAMDEAEARVSDTDSEVERLTTEQARIEGELDDLRQQLDDADTGIASMTREINRLQERLESLRFGFAYMVRNAPMLDAFNPSLRIRQAVLPQLTLDLNFAEAPRVDRCQSCHLGVASDAYAGQSAPFNSHPRLDLYVADTAVHPAGEYGCTICHQGKGRATSFYSAVHTPSNESEAERWHDEYNWAHVELWEWPMRPTDETEASCLKCHIDDTWMPEAPKLERGLSLIENLGCYGCHQLDRFDDARRPGPSLEHVGVKTTPEWAFNWVMDPKSFRANTPMPKFFGNANNSDDYWTERNKVEADAIIAYIFGASADLALDSAPSGDAARGQELVSSVGCLGCHIVEQPGTDAYPAEEPRFTGYRQQGPNLWGVGSKVNADWLYNWVRNPHYYWADTFMPNLRLSDREAADVTAYLMNLKRGEGWENPTIPAVDGALRDEVVLEYLKNSLTSADAEAQLTAMGEEEKRQYLGTQLIGRYACYSCHLIQGFENRGRIGTSLSDWGSKAVAQIDFGYLGIEHTRDAFLRAKLAAPRSVDNGKIKLPQEKARMPNFGLTADEIEAIATAILGYTDEEIPAARKPAKTPRKVAEEAGRNIVDDYNCRGCHIIEGRGGSIQAPIETRRTTEGLSPNAAAAAAFAPPNLNTEGAKTQPTWLYRFIKEPSTIRPWLNVRMPTFGFSDQQLNALTAYFSAVDNAAYPFDEKFTVAHEYPSELVQAGRTLAQGQLQCFRCHVQNGVPPSGQSSDNWAPDLAMAAERLRYEWIQDWIENPQAIFPGTKMPAYFTWDLDEPSFFTAPDGSPVLDADTRRQIEALAAYIMSIGQ